MCGFMGKRKKQRAARRRGLGREQQLRHRARARADLLYDPGTTPELAAEILREVFGDEPVDPDVAVTMGARVGLDRLRAVADAALAGGQGPAALSLAADVALLDDRPDEAEQHAVRALQLRDDPDLHVRRALALGRQGRVADGIQVLDTQLRANPGLEWLQLVRGQLLERAEPALVERFLDRTPFDEFRAAIAGQVDPGADGVEDWIEAGALGRDEAAELAEADPGTPEGRRRRLIAEWAWLMPVLDDDRTPLAELADDERAPAELRRRAEEWLTWALWGLWEVDPRDREPGVVLTDLVTGARLHVQVPQELRDGLPRWSVLLGYVVPVDGVWHAGSAFEAATPLEARILVHELLDDVMDSADELGREGRPMLAWARQVHDELGPLWLPDMAELPSADAVGGLQLTLRAFAPHLVAGLRAMRGTSPVEPSSGFFDVAVDDPGAAWAALSARDDFEADEDDALYWVAEEDADVLRGSLELTEDGAILVDAERDELAALLDLLRELGHPATAEERAEEHEPPEPPVALPELPAAELAEWLRAWPDQPLEEFDGITPREAVEKHGAGLAVEMVIRYLEHDADRRGVELDTTALRGELGLEMQ